MQVIFALFGLLLTLTGSSIGFRYIVRQDPRGKKRYLLYAWSIFLGVLALLALLYIIATLLLVTGIE